MTKLKKNISLSLSLSTCRSVDALIFPKGCECTSLSLSFSLSIFIYICKNGLDPDQTRMEFRKECFVHLKCTHTTERTQCRTKPDAHDKMGFQYISMRVYIVQSHAQIQNIEYLSNTGPGPLKFSKLPSQHSTLGHHRHASETPFKGVSQAGQ